MKVIIKQAGPSKQYAWVGHQPYHNPGHDVPGHVFAAANLPKWTLMGSNIFQVCTYNAHAPFYENYII